MKVLVLNCGSSSVKFKFFQMRGEEVLAAGRVERIGLDSAILTLHVPGRELHRETAPILEHRAAIGRVLQTLSHSELGVIGDPNEIAAVGHRVVHGGEEFSGSVVVTPEVKRVLKDNIELAPLHNPANLAGIAAAEHLLPGVPQVGVFDTAFHASMPRRAFLYPIPFILYRRHRIRRYGFHGTSHRFVSERAAEILGLDPGRARMISCHLGNGASVAAIRGGKSIDTSMGFTPVEGLMMGTRSGDIDPGVVLYLMLKEDLRIGEVNALLNKHSGLMGISGVSGDMREIEEEMDSGSERAREAFEMFEYRLRKYVGAYAAVLGSVDALIFTGGIGENSVRLRGELLENLECLGMELDREANAAARGRELVITTPRSRVTALVIPTNEELIIARDTVRLVGVRPS